MFEEGQEVLLEKARLPVKVVCYGEDFTCVEVESGSKLIVATDRLLPVANTIRIGEFDVPEPLREAPLSTKDNPNRFMYVIKTLGKHPVERCVEQVCYEHNEIFVNNRIAHLTREAATLHTKALLSFTTTELPGV